MSFLDLPRDLSLWGMFQSADLIVKAVIVGLAFASVVTWTVALAKGLELLLARRHARRLLDRLADCSSLAEADSLADSEHSRPRGWRSAVWRRRKSFMEIAAENAHRSGKILGYRRCHI